jgi:hypothetical protein
MTTTSAAQLKRWTTCQTTCLPQLKLKPGQVQGAVFYQGTLVNNISPITTNRKRTCMLWWDQPLLHTNPPKEMETKETYFALLIHHAIFCPFFGGQGWRNKLALTPLADRPCTLEAYHIWLYQVLGTTSSNCLQTWKPILQNDDGRQGCSCNRIYRCVKNDLYSYVGCLLSLLACHVLSRTVNSPHFFGS